MAEDLDSVNPLESNTVSNASKREQTARWDARRALQRDLEGKLDYIKTKVTDPESASVFDDYRRQISSRDFGNPYKTDDGVAQALSDEINMYYQGAANKRSALEKAGDSLTRGVARGIGIAQLFDPGNEKEYNDIVERINVMNPKASGGLRNIRSAKDFGEFASESFLENAPQMASSIGGAAIGSGIGTAVGALATAWTGGLAAPLVPAFQWVGGALGGFFGGLAMNYNEAVNDQLSEGRDFNRGLALTQAGLYSALDAATGGEGRIGRSLATSSAKSLVKSNAKVFSREGAKIIGNEFRKAGVRSAAKAFNESVTKSTGKVIGETLKDIGWEAITEPAQSQIIGNGIRWLQTGEFLAKNADGSDKTSYDVLMDVLDESVGAIFSAAPHSVASRFGTRYSNRAELRSANAAVSKFENATNNDTVRTTMKMLTADGDMSKLTPFDRLMAAEAITNTDRKYIADQLDIDNCNKWRMEHPEDSHKQNNDLFAEGKVKNIASYYRGREQFIEDCLSEDASKIVNAYTELFAPTTLDAFEERHGNEIDVPGTDIDAMANNSQQTDLGEKFTDPDSGISITHLSEDYGGAYVLDAPNDIKMPKGIKVYGSMEEAWNDAQKLVKYAAWRRNIKAARQELCDGILNEINKGNGPRITIRVFDSIMDDTLPDEAKSGILEHEAKGIRTNGFVEHGATGDTVYINADSINSPWDILNVITHEMTHAEINKFLKVQAKENEWDFGDPEQREAARRKLFNVPEGDTRAAEDLFVRNAVLLSHEERSAIQNFMSGIQTTLGKIGINTRGLDVANMNRLLARINAAQGVDIPNEYEEVESREISSRVDADLAGVRGVNESTATNPVEQQDDSEFDFTTITEAVPQRGEQTARIVQENIDGQSGQLDVESDEDFGDEDAAFADSEITRHRAAEYGESVRRRAADARDAQSTLEALRMAEDEANRNGESDSVYTPESEEDEIAARREEAPLALRREEQIKRNRENRAAIIAGLERIKAAQDAKQEQDAAMAEGEAFDLEQRTRIIMDRNGQLMSFIKSLGLSNAEQNKWRDEHRGLWADSQKAFDDRDVAGFDAAVKNIEDSLREFALKAKSEKSEVAARETKNAEMGEESQRNAPASGEDAEVENATTTERVSLGGEAASSDDVTPNTINPVAQTTPVTPSEKLDASVSTDNTDNAVTSVTISNGANGTVTFDISTEDGKIYYTRTAKNAKGKVVGKRSRYEIRDQVVSRKHTLRAIAVTSDGTEIRSIPAQPLPQAVTDSVAEYLRRSTQTKISPTPTATRQADAAQDVTASAPAQREESVDNTPQNQPVDKDAKLSREDRDLLLNDIEETIGSKYDSLSSAKTDKARVGIAKSIIAAADKFSNKHPSIKLPSQSADLVASARDIVDANGAMPKAEPQAQSDSAQQADEVEPYTAPAVDLLRALKNNSTSEKRLIEIAEREKNITDEVANAIFMHRNRKVVKAFAENFPPYMRGTLIEFLKNTDPRVDENVRLVASTAVNANPYLFVLNRAEESGGKIPDISKSDIVSIAGNPSIPPDASVEIISASGARIAANSKLLTEIIPLKRKAFAEHGEYGRAEADYVRGVIVAREYERGENMDTDRAKNSKGSSIKFMTSAVTPAEDTAYMDAVKRGDMETAAQMVREAAAKAMPDTKVVDKDGLPKVVWHGGNFRSDGNYLPDLTEGEMHFGTRKAAEERVAYKYSALKREDPIGYSRSIVIKPYFLDLKNPKHVDDNNGDSSTWLDYAIESDRAFDGVVYRNSSEDEGSDSWGVSWNPSSIKSADPVTYDDAGNVIPLSKRFNPDVNDIRYSTSTYEQGGRDTLVDYAKTQVENGQLDQRDADDIIKHTDMVYKIVKKLADSGEYVNFGKWCDAVVDVDDEGRPYFGVIRTNGDYAYNIDFSTVCKKRRPLDRVFNELVRRGIVNENNISALLSMKNIPRIQEIIKRHGLEVACAICFVDSKRYMIGEDLSKFASLWNGLVEAREKNTSQWKRIIKSARSKTQNRTYPERCALSIDNIPSARVRINATELLSGDMLSDFVKRNPEIGRLFRSFKGQQKAKESTPDTPYNSDVIRLFNHLFNPDVPKTISPEAAYKVGGVRLQSFSDFVPRMAFDYVQMFADLAAKNLPLHTYTKEVDFVKLFAGTDAKINMSLIPQGDGFKHNPDGSVMRDADGNVVYDFSDECFPPDEAFRLRVEHGESGNVGTILVGVNDAHIMAALDDERIDYIIPYHKSNINPIVAEARGIDKFTNYENEQNTLGRDGKALKNAGFDFYGSLTRTQDPRATANEYVEYCKSKGYTPKFNKFKDHKNYYKLLADFRLFNNDGEYAPLKAVKQVNPTAQWKRDFIATIQRGEDMDAKLDENIDQIVGEIQQEVFDSNRRGNVKFMTSADDSWDAYGTSSPSRAGLYASAVAAGVADDYIGVSIPDGKTAYEGSQLRAEGKIRDIVNRAKAGEGLTAAEISALNEELYDIRQREYEANKAYRDAQKAGASVDELSQIEARRIAERAALADIIDTIHKGASTAGRALRSFRNGTTLSMTEFMNDIRKKYPNGYESIPDDIKEQLADLCAKARDLQYEVADAADKVSFKRMTREAIEAVCKERQSKKSNIDPKTAIEYAVEEARKELKSIAEQDVDDVKKLREFDKAKFFRTLLNGFVDYGMRNSNTILQKIKETAAKVGIEADVDEIAAVISGIDGSKSRNVRTPNEAVATRNWMRRLIAERAKLADIRNRNSAADIDAYFKRNGIKTKSPLTNEQKKELALARLDRRIEEIRKRISTGNFNSLLANANNELNSDPEIKKKRDEYRRAMQNLRNLQWKAEYAAKSSAQKFGYNMLMISNFLKGMVASGDLSSIGVQGAILALAHPGAALSAIVPSLKAMIGRNAGSASERAAKIMTEIKAKSQWSKYYDVSGLQLSEVGDMLAPHEEAYTRSKAPDYVRKVFNTKAGRAVSHVTGEWLERSEAAFNIPINIMRSAAFDSVCQSIKDRTGKEPTAREMEVIATYINAASGRGKLILKGRDIASDLAEILWAPRRMIGQVEYVGNFASTLARSVSSKFAMTDNTRAIGTDAAREIFMGLYARPILTYGLIMAIGAILSRMAHPDDDDDDKRLVPNEARYPTSSRFGKLNIDGNVVSITGNLEQYIRLGATLIAGSKRTPNGESKKLGEFGTGDWEDMFLDTLFSNKATPQISTFMNLANRQERFGKKIETVGDAGEMVFKNLLVPLTGRNIAEALREHDDVSKAMLIAGLEFLGYGSWNSNDVPTKDNSLQLLRRYQKELKDAKTMKERAKVYEKAPYMRTRGSEIAKRLKRIQQLKKLVNDGRNVDFNNAQIERETQLLNEIMGVE